MNDSRKRYIGLDVHKHYLIALGVEADLTVVLPARRVELFRLETWMKKNLTKQDEVVLEMTTNTWQLHDELAEYAGSVTVVQPPHVALITRSQVMNDKIAALILARLLATGLLVGIWIPLFEVLEARQFRCLLISSRSLRRVPGRKSDVVDAQWIQTLHTYGLLTSSFRPEEDLVALRTLLRHRAGLLEHRSPHILHMQKALLQMNLQLSQVITDITGETGLRIMRAIVTGERDPYKLRHA